MNAIFVTGTDTGVGKTVITGCLARYLSEKSYNVITQKWIQTGSASVFSQDIKMHLDIMGKEKKDIKKYLSQVNPYIFRTPASAHLASEIENREINRDKIIGSFKFLEAKFDFVIVEGLGGILVPLDRRYLLIDVVKDLDLPIVLVIGNRLGAINHALLTIEALMARNLKILGLVFNNLKNEDKRILKDNPRIIKTLSRQKVFGILPWSSQEGRLYRRFIPIGNRILRRLQSYG